MGFFSWKTQDTNKSIANTYSHKETFKVVMTDDKGNEFIEEDYEGYGIFGGKDYYELVSEMNGGDGSRNDGFNYYEGGTMNPMPKYIYPSLTEEGHWCNGLSPLMCESQGFFY